MTVVVGHLPHKGGRGSLDLGLQLAHTLGRPLAVVTVVPRQWATPSLARVDGEFAEYARQVGERAEAQAREYLSETTVEVEVRYEAVPGRSSSAALVETARRLDAALLVLGSSTDGAEGRITVGATTGKLLHSSPIPLALAPRGYRSDAVDGVPRVTCAFSDNDASVRVVSRVAEVARGVHAPLRVASFGVRGATMYPPEIGLSAEDSVLAGWRDQVVAAQQRLVERGVVDADVERVIGTGAGWGEALSSIDWHPTELLALGSSTVGPAARVFLGSRAAKIIRHAPVPVVVLPAG
ncbi:nucleotide-binding universal stress UspA family protein [Friedmanniella endophytica]|uniref:Nucleotide-binding universal stress UspA family protein n=1 Tax=Microlunatus kandeliicorticis TaxID=1759536 RepID=A0A7W3IRG0_9ACTN|nr:universal stress protein [Microlunatus kandeliicorticis]MBA8793899.1 nucleotide-binding universal stress UspA family protein [Microlunatus kandeliicorticis]